VRIVSVEPIGPDAVNAVFRTDAGFEDWDTCQD
jgi:hypothetical protein